MPYTRRQIRKMIHQYLADENALDLDKPERAVEYNAMAADCRYGLIEDYLTAIPGWASGYTLCGV